MDVLIDLIAYNADDAQQLLRVVDRVGSLIALSTMGVYADTAGRNLKTAHDGHTGFPEFPVPVREDQPTVSADHPWVLAGPLVADLTAAERELGYRPVTTYADAAAES